MKIKVVGNRVIMDGIEMEFESPGKAFEFLKEMANTNVEVAATIETKPEPIFENGNPYNRNRQVSQRRIYTPEQHVLYISYVLRTQGTKMRPIQIRERVNAIFNAGYLQKSITGHIQTAMSNCKAIKKQEYGVYYWDESKASVKLLKRLKQIEEGQNNG